MPLEGYIQKYKKRLQAGLPKKVAKAWIKELKSEKYLQGKNYLLYKGKFCCLGVLLYGVCKLPSSKINNGFLYKSDFYGSEVELSYETILNMNDFFSVLNDTYNLTFKEIADIIYRIIIKEQNFWNTSLAIYRGEKAPISNPILKLIHNLP